MCRVIGLNHVRDLIGKLSIFGETKFELGILEVRFELLMRQENFGSGWDFSRGKRKKI